MDKITAAQAIAQNMSLADVFFTFDVGDMTEREFERYGFIWTWSAPRFGGSADMKQTAYANRHGYDHYRKRMLQVDRIASEIAREAHRTMAVK